MGVGREIASAQDEKMWKMWKDKKTREKKNGTRFCLKSHLLSTKSQSQTHP